MIDSNPSGGTALVPLAMQRYLAFRSGSAGSSQAIRVRFKMLPSPWDVWNGREFWLTAPITGCEGAAIGFGAACPGGVPTFEVSKLTCSPATAAVRNWSTVTGGIVYVIHPGIVPTSRSGAEPAIYEIQAINAACDFAVEGNYSAALEITHARHGDVVGAFDTTSNLWVAADGDVTIVSDVLAVLNKFGNRPFSPAKGRSDVEPCVIDGKINITDVTRLLGAFSGLVYPFAPGQGQCPPDPCSGAGQ
jgi:hypothetical protein